MSSALAVSPKLLHNTGASPTRTHRRFSATMHCTFSPRSARASSRASSARCDSSEKYTPRISRCCGQRSEATLCREQPSAASLCRSHRRPPIIRLLRWSARWHRDRARVARPAHHRRPSRVFSQLLGRHCRRTAPIDVLLAHMRIAFADSGENYGALRVHQAPRAAGLPTSIKRFARLMRGPGWRLDRRRAVVW